MQIFTIDVILFVAKIWEGRWSWNLELYSIILYRFFSSYVKQWQWINKLICFYCGRQGKFFFSSILWEQDWIFEYFRRNILENHFWGQMFYFDLPSVFLAMSILRAPMHLMCWGWTATDKMWTIVALSTMNWNGQISIFENNFFIFYLNWHQLFWKSGCLKLAQNLYSELKSKCICEICNIDCNYEQKKDLYLYSQVYVNFQTFVYFFGSYCAVFVPFS